MAAADIPDVPVPVDDDRLSDHCRKVAFYLNALIRAGALEWTGGGGASINVPLASPSGLEYTSGSLRIDLDTTILVLASAGLGFSKQAKNTFLRGPTTGANAVPTFGAIVAADFGGTPDGTKFLRDDLVFAAVAAGLSSSNFVWNEVPAGTVNGVNDVFTLANTPTAGTIRVYANGLRQTLTTDYTVSGVSITFTAGNIPLTGDVLVADYMK